MKEQITPDQMAKIEEEAWSVNEELDDVLAGGRYIKKQDKNPPSH